ncbi:MAG: hypothetical protein M3R13_08585 [Armatimonadota bacterium]|nr:hypothetical protein [Armatimonadota bacterium]
MAPAAPLKFDEITIGSTPYLRIVSRASEFATGEKMEASLAVAPDGRVALAWQSRRQLNGLSGVFMRTFGKDGMSLGGEQHASSQERFHESKPSVVFGAEPISFFESAWRDDSGAGIFAGDSRVTEAVRGDQADVVTARLSDGRVLAVWSSQITRDKRRLFGRVFRDKGVPEGGEFRVTSSISGSEVLPSIAVKESTIAVAWQRLGQDGQPEGVWVARVAPGTTRELPSAVAGKAAIEPSITAAGSGFAVAWTEPTDAGRHRVRARLLTSSLSHGKELAVPAQDGYQNAAAIAGRGDGTVAVSWNRTGSVGGKEIYYRLFNAAGKPVAAAPLLHPGALAEATGRTRIAWSDGALCFAWAGDAGLGDSKAVHLTRLVPKKTITSTMQSALRKAMTTPRATAKAAPPSGGTRIQFVEQAGPHEPPTYNPKTRLDPWGTGPNQTDGEGDGFNAVISTGWTPPDPHMAVGPNHVGVMTNGQIAFFWKNGRVAFRDEIEDSFGFWGALGATNFVFDPEIVYDRAAGRWMAMCCERSNTNRSYFLLAISDDDDPTGTWFKYRIDVTGLAGNDIDSPNISTDENAVYLSADFFSPSQKYLIYIIRKSDLLVGNPSPLTRSHLITGTQSHGMPMIMDPATPQYLIEHFEASSNTTVRLHAISDPLGTPTRSTFNLTVPAYGLPENPPQAGTSVRPTSFDSRFWSCVYRNGSLWATHHINSTRVLARWYEIRMNGWPNGGTPELVQSGNVDPGGTVRTHFSSIAVDAVGNAAVVCARSSPTEFLSMFRAVRKASDPLGVMPDQAIIKSSNGPYNISRWGDYSGAVVDPADDRTFWGHHEYSQSGDWRTWVESFMPALTTEERFVEQILPILAGPIMGGLAEIAEEDGVAMTVQSTPNPPDRSFGSSVDYVATSTGGHLAGLDVRTVARTGAGLGRANIFLLNRQTGLYDAIGSGNLNPTTFTSVTVPAGPNVNRYVDPVTDEIRMRMVFNLGIQFSTSRPPILLDEVKFVTRY